MAGRSLPSRAPSYGRSGQRGPEARSALPPRFLVISGRGAASVVNARKWPRGARPCAQMAAAGRDVAPMRCAAPRGAYLARPLAEATATARLTEPLSSHPSCVVPIPRTLFALRAPRVGSADWVVAWFLGGPQWCAPPLPMMSHSLCGTMAGTMPAEPETIKASPRTILPGLGGDLASCKSNCDAW